MGSAPELLSWMDNWSDQKKMNILRVVDRSVALLEEPWLKNFEKYRKCWDFDDFWWFFTNSGMTRSGCGFKIWTYILFGSISMSHVRFLNNLAWSRDLRVIQSKSTAPGPRGVPILPGEFRGSSRHCDCNVCLRMIFGDLWSFCQCRRRRTCQESRFSEKRLDFHEFSCIFL